MLAATSTGEGGAGTREETRMRVRMKTWRRALFVVTIWMRPI